MTTRKELIFQGAAIRMNLARILYLLYTMGVIREVLSLRNDFSL